jgi:pentatricopeptide repeat protein
MLSKHPQILEVLEIPQLMDTCVRNNYYEEALQLYSYVHKLNKRYGNSIPIISVRKQFFL